MADNLVIVESPAKAKTIQKFLGKDYKVMSSYGHIRDLEKKDFSIDINNGFEPLYVIPEDKEELVAELKKASKSAKTVWLASDEDREGEAIAWHLSQVLDLKKENTKRIVFHEITKPAIMAAIENPRDIDENLVDAQQARRVLDRIVGFELSPVLWKKIKPALSAGRVQSVAVRLLAEREKEIREFKSEQYYRVGSELLTSGEAVVPCELNKRFADREHAVELLEHCKDTTFTVADIQVKPLKKCPAPPFTTSTLQQEASRKLGFSVAQTMRIAQSLYESGHITYMRTDSVNLSSLAIGTISHEIKETLGEKYLKVRKYHTSSKGAQEAHEAIRPTFISNHDINGNAQEKKLYNLIWKRTIASQMADAQVEKTQVDISIQGRPEMLIANGEVVKFDGFLKVYFETEDEDNINNAPSSEFHMLPPMQVGDKLSLKEMIATQRFTQQPNRYSEAMLVKRLEELGIGRPSTYAPTISTIQARDYVVKGESKGVKRSFEQIVLKGNKISTKSKSELVGNEKGKLIPTDVGMVVNDFLTKYFPQILDYNFTAKVESEFDDIAEGKRKWNDEIKDFYDDFHKNIEEVSSLRLEHKVGERMLGTDPATGKPVSVKIGRYGPLVQLGSTDKPRFASLMKDQSVATITLDEALKLFDMPRMLGIYEHEEIQVAIGRFGPYIKHAGKFVSIPKDMSPYSITFDEAIQLINDNRANKAKKILKTFDEEPEMQVLNGRYGAYISYQGKNYKIPKKMEAEKLTLDDCRAIVADESNASKGGKRGAARRKAATTKK